MSASSNRRRWRGDPACVIEVLQDNPKLLGSKCHARYQHYCNGMTAGEYVEACSAAPRPKDAWIDLTWDRAHGFIEIHAPGSRIASRA